MKRRLFCQISPFTYRLSTAKCIFLRRLKNFFAAVSGKRFSVEISREKLPVTLYKHSSLIRRRLGNADMRLQENKAVNLSIAAPKISGILIHPGETFSFWRLVGNPTAEKGYLEGLTIEGGKPSQGVGGGLCQLTNLIHWMALHSELEIEEHHHHDQIDLFPDYGRKVPFGTGTSVLYNYLDYRLKNNTLNTYQIIVYTDGEYLRGELRAVDRSKFAFHVKAENERFVRTEDGVYRRGEVYRAVVDSRTGRLIKKELIRKNNAKVAYDIDGQKIADDINCT
ncbi:MAG: VanW family protein [Prevotella sp.]|nr:VanW family protein [Prevotella sp.]